MTLGEQIATARDKKSLTRKQLATALGITPQALGRLEHGKRRPSYTLLRRLAVILDLDLNAADEAVQ